MYLIFDVPDPRNAVQNIKIFTMIQFIQFYFKPYKNCIKQERTVSIIRVLLLTTL